MDPSWIAEAEQAGFTAGQLSVAMQQLTPKLKRDEKGYWVEEEETKEEKFARALQVCRENPPKEVTLPKPRPSGLYATKGFTGDQYAYVYRYGYVNRPGTTKDSSRDGDGDGDGDGG